MVVRDIRTFDLAELLSTSEDFSVDSIVVREEYNEDGTPYYTSLEAIIEKNDVEFIDYFGNLMRGKCLILKK